MLYDTTTASMSSMEGEVIKREFLSIRSEAFQRSDSWVVCQGAAQKIKRRVIWEGCGTVVDKWHTRIIQYRRIILIKGILFSRLIIMKKEVVNCISSYVSKYILIRSLFSLNYLQKYQDLTNMQLFALINQEYLPNTRKTLSHIYDLKLCKLVQLAYVVLVLVVLVNHDEVSEL